MRFAVLAACVFAAGFAVSLAFGRLGFMPLDHSIVFDGGWRVLSGQLPLRDFDTPSAIVPSLLQALFFRLFGVGWLVYCAHAAVVNGLFGVVVLALLVLLRARRGVALGYALGSTLVLYPPLGVPYGEPHAFFFLAVGALALVVGWRARERGAVWLPRLLTASLPVWLAAAALSQQNPGLFGAPLLVLLALALPHPGGGRSETLGALLAGLALVGGGLVALAWGVGIGADAAFLNLWSRPRAVAAARLPELARPSVAQLFHSVFRAGLLLSPLVLCASLAALLAGPPTWRRLAGSDSETRVRLGVAGGLVLVGALARAFMNNQPIVGSAYGFLAAGLLHAALDPRTPRVLPGDPRRLVAGALALVALLDAFYLVAIVNPSRMANDLRYDSRIARDLETPALAFLRYQVGSHSKLGARDLDRAIAFLAERPEPFVLIGDNSILYGVTGRPSVSPSLWFHPGVSMPEPGDPGFAAWSRRFRDRVDRLGVRWVVVEHPRTLMHFGLRQLPWLARRVEDSVCPPRTFGPLRIHDLAEEAPCSEP